MQGMSQAKENYLNGQNSEDYEYVQIGKEKSGAIKKRYTLKVGFSFINKNFMDNL
jgi:hypothetical protein